MGKINNTDKDKKNTVNDHTGYVAAFLLGAGIAAGCCWYFMDYSQHDVIDVGNQFMAVKECRDILEANAGVKENVSAEEAINTYVKSIAEDDYTYYFEDDDIRDITNYVNTSGTAEKSGFQIDISEDGNILLTEVDDTLAAYKQGMRKDDVIVSIAGESVSAVGYENIANKLLGKDGTSVNLTIRRDDKIFDIEFVRDSVVYKGVIYEKMGDVAYIKINSISQLDKGALDTALKECKEQKKIIVDLRNNGGGETEAGVYMAAQLCGHSKCVLKYFDGHEEVFEKSFDISVADKKFAVLINGNTASAAETITASLKQGADTILVGENTFGKGIFQAQADFDNGGHLHYTAGSFFVCDWENWQGKGIAPDVEVPMDAELIGTSKDVQLKKAIELLD